MRTCDLICIYCKKTLATCKVAFVIKYFNEPKTWMFCLLWMLNLVWPLIFSHSPPPPSLSSSRAPSHCFWARTWINNRPSVAKASRPTSWRNAASQAPSHHGDRESVTDHVGWRWMIDQRVFFSLLNLKDGQTWKDGGADWASSKYCPVNKGLMNSAYSANNHWIFK